MSPTVRETSLPVNCTVIPGSMSDLDEILELEGRSFTSPWTRKMFEGELSGNPFARFLLVREEAGGRARVLVAYLCYWIVFDEVRLMNLAVASERRRRNLATSLVRQALDEARDAQAKRALLEVRVSNEAARRLYRGLGFRETGNRKDYYRNPVEDAILMALEPLVPTQG
ncbi:putative ribosomal-protein-alanine acetyltransferase [Nitrospira sp.]|nr:putative ribosomal-protein-alanine acetyltransferase [Nitrospira sp.]